MIENALLIHLPERRDRIELLKEEFKYLPLNYQIVSGVRHAKPEIGIGQAHINAILIAKQNEWDNVLIMEDDIVFNGKEKTESYLNECLSNLPEDWDVLLGGIYDGKVKKYNDHWDSVGTFCGLHFYIVNKKAYNRILEYDFTDHIDRWMNSGNRLKCFVTSKFVATQREGFSDNVKQKVDYKNRLKKYDLL